MTAFGIVLSGHEDEIVFVREGRVDGSQTVWVPCVT